MRTSDEVLREFEVPVMSKLLPSHADRYGAMADEIVRLHKANETLKQALEGEKQRRREIDDEAFNYAEQVERAERILAALREPNEAVSNAAFYHWSVCEPSKSEIISALNEVIRAAVVAAECVAADEEVGA